MTLKKTFYRCIYMKVGGSVFVVWVL